VSVFIIVVLTCLLLVGRLPIFIALGLPAAFVIVFIGKVSLIVFAQQMFSGMDKFSLMSMPFFILAANVMVVGGISRRLIDWALSIVGGFRGGLAIAAQIATMFFGALCGSSPATVAAIGKLVYPAMIEQKYPRDFAAGLITTNGAVAILIPPSITFIVYGSVTGASVGKLFIAGIGSGIVYGLATLLYAQGFAHVKKLPRGESFSFGKLAKSTKETIWALGVPIVILGGIYIGIFTPTEAAAVAVVYGTFVGFFIYRELTLRSFLKACYETAVTSAELMLLCASAAIMGWTFTVLQVPQMLTDTLLGISRSPLMFLVWVNIMILILGCFIDGAPAVVIVAPLLAPLAMKYGVDPVHFGVILTTNMAIGMFTPPFGLNLFVASEVTRLPIEKLLPGCIGFFVVSLIALLLITYIPSISMWLPNLVY
jgi:C4-dicarboxylate transporter, DctM subunit